MKVHTDLKRLLAGGLLAGASAMAAAQSNVDATAAPAGAQNSNDAMVAPAAADKQARDIARGDPARWHREDATAQERWRTRQKEIGAAFDEAKNACRQGPAAQRPSCLKAAKATWKEEIAAARAEAGVQAGTRPR